MTSPSQLRPKLETSTVETSQVQGLSRHMRRALGNHEVMELWVPSGREETAFELLPRVACEILLAESEFGVVRQSST